jgi:hypothetical protein
VSGGSVPPVNDGEDLIREAMASRKKAGENQKKKERKW